MTPPQQALYQQTAPLSHMHGVPSVYPQYAAAQGALGYLSGPDRHPGMIPLDDPSASLDSNAPIEGLPDRSTSTPGSYYRASATPSAVEAARALGAPSGGSFYPQQSPPWYGMPDPYQQPGLSSGQLGYSDSPYVSYQGGMSQLQYFFSSIFKFSFSSTLILAYLITFPLSQQPFQIQAHRFRPHHLTKVRKVPTSSCFIFPMT